MKHIITLTVALLPTLAIMPACDLPEDEAELAALVVEEDAEIEDNQGEAVEVAPELELTAKPDPAAAGCQFKVIWPDAGVYEKPNYNKLKTKHSGDIVGHGWYCDVVWAGGYAWQSVAAGIAADDIGWMRQQALKPI